MFSYLVITLLWTIVLINWKLFRDPIYPGFLQSAIWAICATALVSISSDFYPIHEYTWLLVLIGVICFSMGSLLATTRHRPFRQANKPGIIPQRLIIRLLLIVLIGFLPIVMFQAYQFMHSWISENPFVNLRYAISDKTGGDGYGIKAYLIPLAFFIANIQLIRYLSLKDKRELFVTFICIVIAFIYGLLSSGRGVIFSFVLSQIVILLTLRRVSAAQAGILLCVIGATLFVGLGMLTNKMPSVMGGVRGEMIGNTLKAYFLSSIPALDQLITKGSNYDGGIHTFRSILAILKAIGAYIQVPPLVWKFTSVPYSTNLYTVYSPYFEDYGLLVLPLFQVFFGLTHGFLYRKATVKGPRPVYVFLFSIFMFALITQFALDSYFSLLSTWIQYIVYSGLFLVAFAVNAKQAR